MLLTQVAQVPAVCGQPDSEHERRHESRVRNSLTVNIMVALLTTFRVLVKI
jgi:hypothetical protein